jgi:hypothetical protein
MNKQEMNNHEEAKIRNNHSLEHKVGIGVVILGVLALSATAYGITKAMRFGTNEGEGRFGTYIPPYALYSR